MNYSIETIRKGIREELNKIETSGLKRVNLELYVKLKKACANLDRRVSLYELKADNIKWSDLLDEWATIGALFDFYMDTMGTKAVLDLQIFEIKKNLEKIAQELREDNYELIEKKLEASLNLYSKILKVAFNTYEINELIMGFNYQVLKYKIADLVIDDRRDFNIYIPFILRDIERLLNDKEVSDNIKDTLKMYLFDKVLILDSFSKVMRLIILGEGKNELSNEELEKYIDMSIYRESDIERKYHEPNKDIQGRAQTVPDDLEKIFEYWESDAKELVPAAILDNIRRGTFKEIIPVKTLVLNHFKDTRYLADALVSNDYIGKLILIRRAFKQYNVDVSYEFDCAVIAYIDTISHYDLANYIKETSNEFLIDYVIKNKVDVFDKDFINYIGASKNLKLKAYLEENILNISIKTVLESNISNEMKKKAIKNTFIKYETDKGKLKWFLGLFKDIYEEDIINYTSDLIIGLEDVDILWEYAKCLGGDLANNIIKLLNKIKEGEFRNRLLDVLYDVNHEYGKVLVNNSDHIWGYDKDWNFSVNVPLAELTIFEAHFVSSKLDDWRFLMDFVRLHYKARLDWENLYKISENLVPKVQDEFKKYFYLGNRELFFKTIDDISHDFALYMIKENPESVVDFLRYLRGEEIVNLPNATLDIFASAYEKRIGTEGISLTDRVHNTLSKFVYQDFADMVELLTYVMQAGLINNEILMYANTLAFARNLNPLFVRAVLNTKTPYLRASFAPKLYYLNGRDWNIIFLSDKEKEEILNSEDAADIKDLKLRKYYGDLLKLLSTVPDNIKHRIVIEVAKSKLEEYINYIVINYPELRDILLENISDSKLIKKVMEITLNSEGRK